MYTICVVFDFLVLCVCVCLLFTIFADRYVNAQWGMSNNNNALQPSIERIKKLPYFYGYQGRPRINGGILEGNINAI